MLTDVREALIVHSIAIKIQRYVVNTDGELSLQDRKIRAAFGQRSTDNTGILSGAPLSHEDDITISAHLPTRILVRRTCRELRSFRDHVARM